QVAPASESETEAGAGSENEPPAEAPVTAPPRAVAADALKSTWPPASESAPAPPEETDIWPPEPPTERAMPAWPPPSELEEPATPAQVIPTWPDSFAPGVEEPTLPAPAAKAAMPEAKAMTPEPKAAPELKPAAPEPKGEASSASSPGGFAADLPGKRGGEAAPQPA